MASREDLENIKRATVALAFMHENGDPDPRKAPFTTIGSGFCVDPMGLIVTCQHVLAWFLNKNVEDLIAHVSDEDKKKELWPLRDARLITPNVLFFDWERSEQHVIVFPVPAEMGVGKTDCDLGVLRVQRHVAFEDGYPSLQVENYAEIYEGMDLATCGFPLGNYLQEQLGTATSSFARGILSSIIPSPGASLEHVEAFQLDLTATFGNSGGPVFSWSSGKVFGVLQGGLLDNRDKIVPGIAKAEPIYKITGDDTLERARTAKTLGGHTTSL